MIAVYILLTLLLILTFRRLRQFLAFRATFNNLPGDPDIHPLYGNLHTFPGFNIRGIRYEQELSAKYKYFHRMWLGPLEPCLVVYHPDVIKQVLKASEKPRKKGLLSSSYDMLNTWVGEGLVVTNGQKWARDRNLLNHCFHVENLKNYLRNFNSCTQVLISKISEFADQNQKISFDIQPLIHKCA